MVDMIKVEVIEEFTLKRFDELKNIQRKSIEVKGRLFVGDTFECDEDMVKYLTGNNEQGKIVVKVIEVEPEIIIDEEKIVKKVFEEQKSNKKKKSSKK